MHCQIVYFMLPKARRLILLRSKANVFARQKAHMFVIFTFYCSCIKNPRADAVCARTRLFKEQKVFGCNSADGRNRNMPERCFDRFEVFHSECTGGEQLHNIRA